MRKIENVEAMGVLASVFVVRSRVSWYSMKGLDPVNSIYIPLSTKPEQWPSLQRPRRTLYDELILSIDLEYPDRVSYNRLTRRYVPFWRIDAEGHSLCR